MVTPHHQFPFLFSSIVPSLSPLGSFFLPCKSSNYNTAWHASVYAWTLSHLLTQKLCFVQSHSPPRDKHPGLRLSDCHTAIAKTSDTYDSSISFFHPNKVTVLLHDTPHFFSILVKQYPSFLILLAVSLN